MKCEYCDRLLEATDRSVWRLVVGWERKASAYATTRKGGSDIALRQLRDRYACNACVQRKKRGVHPTQEAML